MVRHVHCATRCVVHVTLTVCDHLDLTHHTPHCRHSSQRLSPTPSARCGCASWRVLSTSIARFGDVRMCAHCMCVYVRITCVTQCRPHCRSACSCVLSRHRRTATRVRCVRVRARVRLRCWNQASLRARLDALARTLLRKVRSVTWCLASTNACRQGVAATFATLVDAIGRSTRTVGIVTVLADSYITCVGRVVRVLSHCVQVSAIDGCAARCARRRARRRRDDAGDGRWERCVLCAVCFVVC
jgi:hypothetical protein